MFVGELLAEWQLILELFSLLILPNSKILTVLSVDLVSILPQFPCIFRGKVHNGFGLKGDLVSFPVMRRDRLRNRKSIRQFQKRVDDAADNNPVGVHFRAAGE